MAVNLVRPSGETQGKPGVRALVPDQLSDPEYREAENQFARLVRHEDLDRKIQTQPETVDFFEQMLERALSRAFQENGDNATDHLFLQRILYRINRLKLFWFDELAHYQNERSIYLLEVRNQIEEEWQHWENNRINRDAIQGEDPAPALQKRAARDLDPEPSRDALYLRHDMGREGYRRLLEITSLDGLVEASQLSRVLGGVSNEIHSMLTRVLLEEYGGGKLNRKHSSFFKQMLEDFGMNAEPEAYFETVPWEVLANINLSFLLSERKRYFLRYVGGLLYFEISAPASFRNYRDAAQRLELPETSRGYWDVHIKEDERHGQWMLEDVALPLVSHYPDQAWEMIWGYDQQRDFAIRAGSAIARAVRQVEAGP